LGLFLDEEALADASSLAQVRHRDVKEVVGDVSPDPVGEALG
jgi:hypothetical protein